MHFSSVYSSVAFFPFALGIGMLLIFKFDDYFLCTSVSQRAVVSAAFFSFLFFSFLSFFFFFETIEHVA